MKNFSFSEKIAVPQLPIWGNYKTFLDACGGTGDTGIKVTQRNPHLKTYIGELPELEEDIN